MKPDVDQPDNPLFTNGDNAHLNACVGENGGPYELYDYAMGFFIGGHACVQMAEEEAGPVDLLVYPSAFNYRHGIELFLKQLVVSFNEILKSGETFKKNHGMLSLWQEVVRLHGELPKPLLAEEQVKRVDELIGYFDAFDPTGQVFRYPEDIKGNKHLADHLLINVEILRDQMKELQEIFDDWYHRASFFGL